MSEPLNEAEALLAALGKRVRHGIAKTYPPSPKERAVVSDVVRRQWQQEQQALQARETPAEREARLQREQAQARAKAAAEQASRQAREQEAEKARKARQQSHEQDHGHSH